MTATTIGRRGPSARSAAGLVIAVLTALAGCGSDDALVAELEPLEAVPAEDTEDNQPPKVVEVRFEPAQPAQGDQLQAVVTARDPNGDRVELGYRWRIDGDVVQEGQAQLDLGDVARGARVEVEVTASDGTAASDAVWASVEVIDRPPTISGMAIEPISSVAPGQSVVVYPTGTDPDGDEVTFEFQWLVNGNETGTHGSTFSSEGLKQGDRIRVRVIATDGSTRSQPAESEDVVVGSAHPEFTSVPPGLTDEGVFRYLLEARDPDGDRNLRYRLKQGPEGMTIDSVLGEIVWRPTAENAGAHTVSATVRDSSGLETTQTFEVTVAPAEPPASATK